MIMFWIRTLYLLICIVVTITHGDTTISPPTSKQCANPSKLSSGDGDYILIGLYPAYISTVSPKANGVMYMKVVKYVLEEFNKNSTFKVGYRFYDTCGESQLDISREISVDILLSPHYGAKSSTPSLSPQQQSTCSCDDIGNLGYVVGLVGPASSTVSEQTSNLLSPAELPLISYSSTSVELNEKDKFPYFMRTISADDYQSRVISDLVSVFSWKYVSLLASDNLYGRSGTSGLVELFKSQGICLAVNKLFKVPYDREEIARLVEEVKLDSKAKVIIVWASVTPSRWILESAAKVGLYNRTWIFTEGVGASSMLLASNAKVVRGAFTIIPVSGYSPAFEDYFFNMRYPDADSRLIEKIWLRRLFERYGIENSTLMEVHRRFQRYKIAIVWNSVLTYLNALTKYVRDFGNSSSNPRGFPRISDRKLFFHNYLRKVNFTTLDGDSVHFDDAGNIGNPRYKILNIHVHDGVNMKYEEAGSWKEGRLTLNHSNILWGGGVKPRSRCSEECPPGRYPLQSNKVCCWECVPCQNGFVKETAGQDVCLQCPANTLPDSDKIRCIPYVYQKTAYGFEVNIIVYLLMAVTSPCILFTLFVFVYFRSKKIVKASNFPLSVLQLVAQLLIVLCGWLMTVDISLVTCCMYHYLTSFFTIIVMSAIMVKTEMLLRIFNMRHRLSKDDVLDEVKREIKILIVVVFIYVFIHGVLWDMYPITIVEEYQPEHHKIVRVCDHTPQTIASALCIFILSMMCSVQVFRNRKLPSLYNESKLIMYAVFVLDIGLIVILMVTMIVRRNNRTLVVYYSVYASNAWLFVAMFGSKMYQLIVPVLRNRRKKKQGVADSKSSFCIYEKKNKRSSMLNLTSTRSQEPTR